MFWRISIRSDKFNHFWHFLHNKCLRLLNVVVIIPNFHDLSRFPAHTPPKYQSIRTIL